MSGIVYQQEDIVRYALDVAALIVLAAFAWAIIGPKPFKDRRIWPRVVWLTAALLALHMCLDIFYWHHPFQIIHFTIRALILLMLMALAIKGSRSTRWG